MNFTDTASDLRPREEWLDGVMLNWSGPARGLLGCSILVHGRRPDPQEARTSLEAIERIDNCFAVSLESLI